MKKTTMEIRSWPDSALQDVCAACDGTEGRRRTAYRALDLGIAHDFVEQMVR